MMNRMFKKVAAAVLLPVLVAVLGIACGGGDTALSRAEVEEIVRAELADAPAPADPGPSRAEVEGIVQDAITAAPKPGLTRAEAEEIVRGELADAPTPPEPSLSRGEVERIVQDAVAAAPELGLTLAETEMITRSVVASILLRSAPAEYTKFFVNNAISRYETLGLDATLAYYNRPESIDRQWYVFIIDENDLVVGHPDAQRLGLDLKGWVGTDANGYNFGSEMLSATEEGKWVSYVYRNPESGSLGSDHTGALQLKNAWVVSHDGLLFASGWYVNADEFTKALVATAVRVFRSVGLEATITYFNSPESDFAGLVSTIEYYNSADNVEGDWFAFIADESGKIIDHYHKEMVGKHLRDIFGTDVFETTEAGNWVTTEDVRVWVVSDGGMTFESGWHHDESG